MKAVMWNEPIINDHMYVVLVAVEELVSKFSSMNIDWITKGRAAAAHEPMRVEIA